jgi:hypothetical protein
MDDNLLYQPAKDQEKELLSPTKPITTTATA